MGSQYNLSTVESDFISEVAFASAIKEGEKLADHDLIIPSSLDQDGYDSVADEYKCVDIDNDALALSPEDATLSRIDQYRTRQTIKVSIKSALARSTNVVTKLAPMGCAFIDYMDEIGEDVSSLKFERDMHVRFFGEADKIAHATQSFFDALRPSLECINQGSNSERDRLSWRAEVAAIVVASYGKVSRIPKAMWSKFETTFGNDALSLAKIFRAKITHTEAKKWLANRSIRHSVCEYASLDPKLVLQLAAKV